MVLRYAVAGFGICRQIRNICIRNFSSTTYWVGGKITTIINIKKLERKQSFECPSLQVMLRCEFFLWQRVSASKWFLLHDSLFAQRVWSTKFSFVTFHIGNHTTTNQQNERTQTLAMSIIQIADCECLLWMEFSHWMISWPRQSCLPEHNATQCWKTTKRTMDNNYYHWAMDFIMAKEWVRLWIPNYIKGWLVFIIDWLSWTTDLMSSKWKVCLKTSLPLSLKIPFSRDPTML